MTHNRFVGGGGKGGGGGIGDLSIFQPPQVLYVAPMSPSAQPLGGALLHLPFQSLEDACNAIGTPVDAADEARRFEIKMSSGVHTLGANAVIPENRTVSIVAKGQVQYGTSGSPKSISYSTDAVNEFDPTVTKRVAINGVVITDSLIVSSANPLGYTLSLTGTSVNGTIDGTAAAGATGILQIVGGVQGAVNGTGFDITIADNTRFSGSVTCNSVGTWRHTRVAGVTTSAPAITAGLGFHNCDLNGAFSGNPAGSWVMDARTYYRALANGATFAPGAYDGMSFHVAADGAQGISVEPDEIRGTGTTGGLNITTGPAAPPPTAGLIQIQANQNVSITSTAGVIELNSNCDALAGIDVTGNLGIGGAVVAETGNALVLGTGTDRAPQVPQLTTTQRNALVASNGMLIYNTTTEQFEQYDGGWGPLGSGGALVGTDSESWNVNQDAVATDTQDTQCMWSMGRGAGGLTVQEWRVFCDHDYEGAAGSYLARFALQFALDNAGVYATAFAIRGSDRLATFMGPLEANGGLLVTGNNIAFDPTGTYALNMDSGQTAQIDISDNLTGAFRVTQAGNIYFSLNTTNGAENIQLGNAITNPKLVQVGSGQVSFDGNVDALSGLDVSGAALTLTDQNFIHSVGGTGNVSVAWTFSGGLTNSAGEFLVSGGNVQVNDDIGFSFGNSDDVVVTWDTTPGYLSFVAANAVAAGQPALRFETPMGDNVMAVNSEFVTTRPAAMTSGSGFVCVSAEPTRHASDASGSQAFAFGAAAIAQTGSATVVGFMCGATGYDYALSCPDNTPINFGAGIGTDGTIQWRSAGELEILASNGDIAIDAAVAINLDIATSAVCEIDATSITVQAGITLDTVGTGNINLPQNASARFQIEGVSTGATVTAANLDTLTNGGDAVALHNHSRLTDAQIVVEYTTGEAINENECLCIDDNGANQNRVYKADASAGGAERMNAVGLARASAGIGTTVQIVIVGPVGVLDAEWDAVPGFADVGKVVYVSTTAGNLTLTKPSVQNQGVQKVGTVAYADASVDTTVIVVQPGPTDLVP